MDEQMKIHKVTQFLRDINLGRLAGTIRRNKLTFEKMEKLTDLEWREIGIDRTEMKLIKKNMVYYRDLPDGSEIDEEERRQMLKDIADEKRREALSKSSYFGDRAVRSSPVGPDNV